MARFVTIMQSAYSEIILHTVGVRMIRRRVAPKQHLAATVHSIVGAILWVSAAQSSAIVTKGTSSATVTPH